MDVVPLEDELHRMREEALGRQQEISNVLSQWRDMQPMPSDSYQPPTDISSHVRIMILCETKLGLLKAYYITSLKTSLATMSSMVLI